MKKRYLGIFFVFLATLCFSTNGLLCKVLTWSGMSLNAVGNLIAAGIIAVYMAAVRHRFVLNKSVFIGGLFVFATNLLSTYAAKMTSAANAIVLQFTMPVFIILAERLFFKKRPGKLDLVTTCVIIVGIVCFAADGLSVGHIAGDGVALLSGITVAGVYLLEEMPGNDSFSAILVGKLLDFVVGIPAVVHEPRLAGWALAGLIAFGVVQCGLGYLFLPLGLKYAEPVPAALMSAAEPVLNPIWVLLFYPGETVTPASVIGTVVVLSAMIVYNVIKAKRDNAVPSAETDL